LKGGVDEEKNKERRKKTYEKEVGEESVYLLYSKLLHLSLFRFHCVGECWD
jgi:hypothetical protein